MDVRIESLLEGAARASGVVAVIDVLRAFTTAAVAFANGGHVSQNQRFLAKGALLEIILQMRVRPFLINLDRCNSRLRFGAV